MKIKGGTLIYVMCVLILSGCHFPLAIEAIEPEQPSTIFPTASRTMMQSTSISPSPDTSISPIAISPTTSKKSVALSLVAIAENSQTSLAYDYAENIHDGRGITFGIIGFTTGTYDGNDWLHYYTRLNPDNRLAKYIPAMDAIDAGPHPDGMNDDVTGLDGFINDFHASLNDPYFKQSQLDKMDELYWNPSLEMAQNLCVKEVITLSQIFDASIQHGVDGMTEIVFQTNRALGGDPKDGIDELTWLTKFLDIRQEILSQDPSWKESTDRIKMYRRLLQTGNYSLDVPFTVTCYGDTFLVTGKGVLPLPSISIRTHPQFNP